MQGSPSVVNALNNVLAHVLALHQQAHLEEHWFESMGYSLSVWFDKIETKSHEEMNHYLMNRIRNLGGKIKVAWAWQPDYDESIGPAMASLVASMNKTRDAYQKASTAAENDDDHVTVKMLWCHLKHLEKWIVKFEARIAQLDTIGETAFLAEYL